MKVDVGQSSFPILLVTQTQETAFDAFHRFSSCVRVSQENDQENLNAALNELRMTVTLSKGIVHGWTRKLNFNIKNSI